MTQETPKPAKNNIYLASIIEGLEQIFDEEKEINFTEKFPDIEPNENSKDFLDLGKLEVTDKYFLQNIFEKIYTDNKTSFFNLKPLSVEKKDLFPNREPKSELKDLKKNFIDDFAKIPKNSLETLHYLIKKYFSLVPINETYQYINVFEYLKMRSAFAQSYADFKNNEDKIDENKPFLLVAFGLSGIQDFLYNIASGKAAKSLKGRSFYIHLLLDSIVQKLIQDCKNAGINASIGQIIYASGGKAYLLLPNLQKVRGIIQDLHKKVEKQIYHEHKERLYVESAVVAFAENDLDNIASLWEEIDQQTNQQKYKRYQNLLIDDFDTFFEPNAEDGFDTLDNDKTVCAVTGELIENPTEKNNLLKEVNGEPVWVTKSVLTQSKLGLKLKNSDFYFTSKNIIHQKFNFLFDKNTIIKKIHKLPQKSAILHSINDINDFLILDAKTNIPQGFMFYGGNKQALKKNEKGDYIKDKHGNFEEKDYEELTGLENEEDKGKGFRRLGVLRMDVDGLGTLFAEKMKEKKELQNFAAYATVSAHLDTFFAGYLNEIRNQEKYKDWVNILYSGGDDIFTVGRWDLILEFAKEIQEKFKDFVGDKPTLSAGVAMIGGKFPISKGANLAGEAEEQAKEFISEEDIPKNAITLFGETIAWNQEFEAVYKLKNIIKDWLENYEETGFSKGLVYKIMRFKQLKDAGLQDWRWQSAYYFARLQKNKEKSRQAFDMLKEAFFCGILKLERNHTTEELNFKFTSKRAIDLLAIACRWADLEGRMKDNTSEPSENLELSESD